MNSQSNEQLTLNPNVTEAATNTVRWPARMRTTLGLLGAASVLAGCGAGESVHAIAEQASHTDSPSERLEAAFGAFEQGDCDEFVKYFVEEQRSQAAESCQEVAQVLTSMDSEVVDTQIDGDTAIVTTRVRFDTVLGTDDDEWDNPHKYPFVKLDGQWYFDKE